MTIHPLTSSTSPLHLEYDLDESGAGAPSLGAVFGEVTSSSAAAAAAATVPSAMSSRAGTLDSRRRMETGNDVTLSEGGIVGSGGIDAMMMSFSQNASPLHPLTGVADVVSSVNNNNNAAASNHSDEDGGSSLAGTGAVGGFPPLLCPPMMSVRWSSTLERTPLSDASGAASMVSSSGVESSAGFLCAADRAGFSTATLDRGGCYSTLERRRFTIENNHHHHQGEEVGGRRGGGINHNASYDTQSINRNASYDMTLNIPGEESTI